MTPLLGAGARGAPYEKAGEVAVRAVRTYIDNIVNIDTRTEKNGQDLCDTDGNSGKRPDRQQEVQVHCQEIVLAFGVQEERDAARLQVLIDQTFPDGD